MHNISFKHQNAEASKPLVIPMHVVCNTEEEKVLANVLANSRKIKRWIKTVEEHDGIAVVCGSSPSIADYVEDIRQHQANGAKLFALNGAARFLTENGIRADYQIIMDAQPRTIELIGDAEQHLFASQVDPAMFDKVPGAILWHSTHGNTLVDVQDGFPQHDDDYCLIGSSATVGNTSLALLYAMGYREFKIYGMDSSHRGDASHVLHQSINDGDPCLKTNFNGKDYLCSFTMKMQADTFMHRARALEQAGCVFEVFGDGLLPAMWNTPVVVTGEQDKYERMWEFSCYREVAPGEGAAERFIEVFDPAGSVIDFGCGTGRGALKLHAAGLDVLLTDFADNSRDIEAMGLPFRHVDLREPQSIHGDYGFCTDVMEHIEPMHVDTVIRNIMGCVKKCFFQICLVEDDMGEVIGHTLHWSVHSLVWWKNAFTRLGYGVEWSEDLGNNARFLISTT